MSNNFLNTLQYRFLYLSIWVIITIAQLFLIKYYVVNIPFQTVLCDLLVGNIFQALCILFLWYPIKYYRNGFSIPLFFLFHLFLLLLSLAICFGLGFFITNILLPSNPDYLPYFITLLPVKIVSGTLIYLVFALIYYLFFAISEIKTQKEVLDNIESASTTKPIEKITRISIKKKHEISFISVNQIFYIEANGDYVLIYTAENKFLKDRTMKYWETHLPENLFVRIHRSFIVNIECISKIELYEKETYKVQLKNGSSLKVSNAGYKLLKQKMQL